MSDPIIKIITGQSALSKGIAAAGTDGLNIVFSSASAAADRLPFDREQLFGVLHFRLYETDRARKRSGWFWGRLYNKFSGEDPGYIPVSGTHLRQVFDAMRIQTPDFVINAGQYLLRYDYAKRAYDQLKQEREADRA